jgi:hypothetical protein
MRKSVTKETHDDFISDTHKSKESINQNHLDVSKDEKNKILTKAVRNVADIWQINNKQLGSIIGYSEASISRLKNGQTVIECGHKEGELAVFLVRIFRGLNAFMGRNYDNQRLWLYAYNHDLEGKPIDLMMDIQGLVKVADYTDHMCGY